VSHTDGMSSRGVVHAAGGVISRQSKRGHFEVLLIHRPLRQDWTFPKGKLEAGETHEACALREVEEETALRCLLGRELATTSHRDGKGRLKIVRYWMMDPGEGVAEPRNEVDEVRWLSLEDAAQLLTYPHHRELLIAFSGQVASSR